MNQIKLLHHSDGAHGWVEVKKSLFNQIADIKNISSYSYQNKQSYYLEEDCDAGILIDALEKEGRPFMLISIDDDHPSPIRGYDRIN
jgi:hypothetical protein